MVTPIISRGALCVIIFSGVALKLYIYLQNQTPKNSRTAEVNGGNERRRYPTMSEVNGKTLSISFRHRRGGNRTQQQNFHRQECGQRTGTR